ncbi:hypothetical protein [Aeromonas enteropelogenes]|uniref:hypothetical protein n=1 Tax=Aeromonas enteropelogenes TaxID=29489 RepID=UPI003B9F6A25
MDVFKLSSDDLREFSITRENVELHTQRKSPWFIQEDGEIRHFAVCPACDNTIQLIRLYDDQHSPYGKHYLTKRRPGLGRYSPEEYDSCPYADKNRNQRPDREARRQESELTNKIKSTLIEQFDRVIYLLEKQLSMRISKGLATEMLRDFIAARGWQYGAATTQNIPWIFAYFMLSKTMFGREWGAPALQQAISNHYPNAVWDNNVLKSREGYLSPRFCFLYHHRRVVDHHLKETMTFSVSTDQQQVIFEQQIPIEGSQFAYLLAIPEGKCHRQWHWVELAREVFNAH